MRAELSSTRRRSPNAWSVGDLIHWYAGDLPSGERYEGDLELVEVHPRVVGRRPKGEEFLVRMAAVGTGEKHDYALIPWRRRALGILPAAAPADA